MQSKTHQLPAPSASAVLRTCTPPSSHAIIGKWSQMQPITAGDAIVAALEANGVHTIFGLPGVQMYPLFDALYRRKQFIRTVSARHEQGCAYMAYGFAQSTGQPGVFSVVPGPGILNAGAALNVAWAANAPVLCITGEIATPFIGKRRGHLHEMPHQLATLRSFVKWAERIERPADVPPSSTRPFDECSPAAAVLSLSKLPGMFLPLVNQFPLPLPPIIPPPPAPSPHALDQPSTSRQRQRPMIMVGSGAQHASPEVLALAENFAPPSHLFAADAASSPKITSSVSPTTLPRDYSHKSTSCSASVLASNFRTCAGPRTTCNTTPSSSLLRT